MGEQEQILDGTRQPQRRAEQATTSRIGGTGSSADTLPRAQPRTTGVARAPTPPPMRVMAVDDERGVLQVVEIALSMAGHQVRSFETLSASRAAFLEDPAAFDAAIIDQNLGDGSGLELAQQMRENNGTMLIVLASGRPNEELTRAARALRVQLLPKPFSLESLQAALDIH